MSTPPPNNTSTAVPHPRTEAVDTQADEAGQPPLADVQAQLDLPSVDDAPAAADPGQLEPADPESQLDEAVASEQDATEPARSLPKTLARSLKRRAMRLARARVDVVMTTWDSLTVIWKIPPRHRSYWLGVPEKSCRLSAQRVHISVPDLAALTRLATSGVLTGSTFCLSVTVQDVPRWLRGGNRSVRTLWATTSQSWRVQPGPTPGCTSTTATLTWARKRPLDRALSDLLSLHTREQAWPQTGGQIYGEDRHAFARGATTWPRAYLVERSPYDSGELLGPYSSPPAQAPVSFASWPLVTTVANPYHRELAGLPATYAARVVPDASQRRGGPAASCLEVIATNGETAVRLDPHRSPEAQISPGNASDTWVKFATLELPNDWPVAASWADSQPQQRFLSLALRGLAACGMILRCPNPAVREALRSQGLLVEDTTLITPSSLEVASPAEILGGYARSVASSRAALISSDALLRVSPLAGLYGTPAALNPLVQLPRISITASSKRADDLPTCLEYLAAQNYPAFEIVLGTHGYTLPGDFIEAWQEKLAARHVQLRVVAMPEQLSFGQVLGQLATLADAELITKVDDDDHYGPHHLTDLLLAHRFSGADMVAKSSRFTYFTDHDFTIDRTWGAKEAFDGTPAGGTMMITRSALTQIGGWSPSVRHVDSDLIARARAYGLPRYRTQSLGYVYVRRSSGHTWAADHDDLLAQGQHRYNGLPPELLG